MNKKPQPGDLDYVNLSIPAANEFKAARRKYQKPKAQPDEIMAKFNLSDGEWDELPAKIKVVLGYFADLLNDLLNSEDSDCQHKWNEDEDRIEVCALCGEERGEDR